MFTAQRDALATTVTPPRALRIDNLIITLTHTREITVHDNKIARVRTPRILLTQNFLLSQQLTLLQVVTSTSYIYFLINIFNENVTERKREREL